jgi:hypothetical protein
MGTTDANKTAHRSGKKGDLEAEQPPTKPPSTCHGANPDHPGRLVNEAVINAD